MTKSDTEKRNRELSILKTMAEELNRSVDLDEILTVTLAQAAELLDLRTGWIWLIKEDGQASYLAASQNLPPALTVERMEGSCYCLDTYRAGDMAGAANLNVITCSRLKYLSDGTAGLRYHASIPLYAHGNKIGVLNLASTDWRELSPEELRLLHTIGDLVSIGIERARLFERSVQIGALEERNRLAREIHDTLAQGLAGISMQLETAEALLEQPSQAQDIRRTIRQALDLTRSSLDEARRSVLDLRAAPLEGRDLATALRELVASQRIKGELEVKFRVTGENHPLPASVEVGLYRIAQEALTNALQHAKARSLAIRLAATPDEVRLTVRDDGAGFDPDQLGPERYGLLGISERVKLLGGRFDLQTGRRAGTQLEIVVPLR